MKKIPMSLLSTCVFITIFLTIAVLTASCKKEDTGVTEPIIGVTAHLQDFTLKDAENIMEDTETSKIDDHNSDTLQKDQSQISTDTANSDANNNSSPSLDKSTVITLINKLTAQSATKSYSWQRSCNYTPNGSIDVGGPKFTSMLNSIVDSIASGQTLDTVMGDFIGIGNARGNVKNGNICKEMNGHSEYLLAPTHFTDSDIISYTQNDNTFVLKIKNCINPERDSKNPLNHTTNDFVTPTSMTELVEGNSKGLMKIDRDTSFARYSSIVVKATIKDNQLTRYEVSYLLKSDPLVLKVKIAPVPIKGYGEVKLIESYSNFY